MSAVTKTSPENCTICLGELEAQPKQIDCGHKFDTACIDRWLTTQSAGGRKDAECPLCRRIIVPKTDLRLPIAVSNHFGNPAPRMAGSIYGIGLNDLRMALRLQELLSQGWTIRPADISNFPPHMLMVAGLIMNTVGLMRFLREQLQSHAHSNPVTLVGGSSVTLLSISEGNEFTIVSENARAPIENRANLRISLEDVLPEASQQAPIPEPLPERRMVVRPSMEVFVLQSQGQNPALDRLTSTIRGIGSMQRVNSIVERVLQDFNFLGQMFNNLNRSLESFSRPFRALDQIMALADIVRITRKDS